MVAHKWALGLAVATSLIAAAPQIYFRIDHQADGIYQGIELLPDSPWSARAREVQDGHPNFGAIYYKDGKDDPYLFQPLGSIVVAYTGQALRLDINNTLLLFRLVYVGLASLLIYAFVYLLARDKGAALAAAAVLLLAESVLTGFGVMELLRGRSPDDFLRIARPVNPAMIYIFFFGFLAAFWKFFERLDWRWAAAAAVLLGANFYNYFYTWTYLFAFGGVLGLSLLLRRKWEEALKVAAVYIGSLVVAAPYLLNLYATTKHPEYLGASLRKGVIETHEPLFVGFVVLLALGAFLIFYPREDKKRYFFWLALLVAPFVTLNQQLLTGKILQAGHYHWFFHKPMAIILGIVLALYLIKKYLPQPMLRKTLVALAVVGSIGVGVFVQAASYQSGTNDGGQVAIERQKYGPAMQWLSANAQKEEVVFANDEASHMVAIYTPLNLFFHRAGMYSLAATHERLLDNQYAFLRLRGIGRDDAAQVIYDERNDLSGLIWGMHYRELLGAYDLVPQEKLDEVTEGYLATLKTLEREWFRALLEKYDVSYLVWDKGADPAWRPSRFSFLREAAAFGDIVIYEVVL